jgi:5'-nucleotidase, C-terminal domain
VKSKHLLKLGSFSLLLTMTPLAVQAACSSAPQTLSGTQQMFGKMLDYKVIIAKDGRISKVTFGCDVDNQGWVSNSTIKSGVTLRGGVLTGYIVNEGTITDIEFRGASIVGGTLAGKIVNRSQVGGVFKNVNLAASAEISGGVLEGNITGDKKSPATLNNLKVKVGSKLVGVKLGNNVKLGKGVVVEGETGTTPPPVTPGTDKPTDTGTTDTGKTETGKTETGTTETGKTDTGTTETGKTDTGTTETGKTDTGTTETGKTDTGTTETGKTDTGTTDTETTDTETTDTSEVVGEAGIALEGGDGLDTQETLLADFVADAVLAGAKKLDKTVDMVLLNSGSIHGSIPAGPVTAKDIAAVAPDLGNAVVLLDVTGDQLIQALDHGLMPGDGKVERAFPIIAGLKVTYCSVTPCEKTLVEGKVVQKVTVSGKAIKLENTYRLATNDFLAMGGASYTMLASACRDGSFCEKTETLISALLEEEFKGSKAPVTQKLDGRLKVADK